MRKKLLPLLLVELLVFGLTLSIPPAQSAQADSFADPAFQKLWNRTDAAGLDTSARPTFWGDALATKTERYDNSPGGQRLVQYFDKGRMEITQPKGDATNEWYVSSGLLVRDLVGGGVEVGDNLVQVYDPVALPIAGDSDNVLAATPFYRDFAVDAFEGAASRSAVGATITRTIKRGGVRGVRPSTTTPKVTIGYFEQTSHHNIAAPFWDFLNATGPVQNPAGQTVTGSLAEWQYLVGFPMTEPYWITANFGGTSQEVVIQLFQRRVLIFNPAAPAGKQVDFTDVGRDWYNWQYGPPPSTNISIPDVPISIDATITPSYGDLETLFHATATGFAANEDVQLLVQVPSGQIYSSEQVQVRVDATGTVKFSFLGSDLAFERDEGPTGSEGLYKLELTGVNSGHVSTIYYDITAHVPLTPTSPYTVDNSPAPPSVNAEVSPSVGPRGSTFPVFLDGFQIKDIIHDKLSAWVTAPDGSVNGIDLRTTDIIVDAQESLDGTDLILSSPPDPGIWALTIVERSNPSHQAIIYLKVTDAPPEVPTFGSLDTYTSGTVSAVNRSSAWVSNIKFSLLHPVSPVQLQGGDDGDN